jgi:aldehyde dehydrogenase (NAD+)
VSKEFVAACKKAVVELYGPDPKTKSDYSRIISAREVKRLKGLIEPDKIIHGGESDEEARYLAPRFFILCVGMTH